MSAKSLIIFGLLLVFSDLACGQVRCSPTPCIPGKTFVVSAVYLHVKPTYA